MIAATAVATVETDPSDLAGSSIERAAPLRQNGKGTLYAT